MSKTPLKITEEFLEEARRAGTKECPFWTVDNDYIFVDQVDNLDCVESIFYDRDALLHYNVPATKLRRELQKAGHAPQYLYVAKLK